MNYLQIESLPVFLHLLLLDPSLVLSSVCVGSDLRYRFSCFFLHLLQEAYIGLSFSQ